MLNQKEGVFQVTSSILEDNNVEFQGAILDCQAAVALKKSVVQAVAMGIIGGSIQMDDKSRAKYDTAEKMKSYASGLVNNWWRKDTRLNGGSKYVAKNPGSRQGAGDAQLKQLKALLEIKAGDAAAVAAIQEAIELRKMEIAETKAKKVEVDLDKIPVELREKLGL